MHRENIERRFKKCEGSDLNRILTPKFKFVFSISGMLSLTKLVQDSYELGLNKLVQNIIKAYEHTLRQLLQPIEDLVREVILIFELNIVVRDHWTHLCAFLIFYLSGLRYTPRRFCYAVWIFRIWAGLIALVFSILSASAFAEVSSFTMVFFSSLLLMSGLYLYYLPLHLWRATFDRPIELAYYNENETWSDYFYRQHKDLINIVVNFLTSFVCMTCLALTFDLKPTVALLMAVFAAVVAIRFMMAGFGQALEWRSQPANSGRAFKDILMSAANTKSSIHYAMAIFGMALLILLGSYGVATS